VVREAMTDDELLVTRAKIAAGCAWTKADGHPITLEAEVSNEREVRQILRDCAARIATLSALLQSQPPDRACVSCWGLRLLPRGMASVVGYFPCPKCGDNREDE